jgi:hypothetical protein
LFRYSVFSKREMQYNQTIKGQQVRVGNWFEELKLKEETGIRFYPDPQDKKSTLLTRSRCIDHTDQILPKDYATVTKTTLPDPRTHPGFRKHDTVGPRQRMIEDTLKKSIEDEIARKTTQDFHDSRKLTYLTTTKESFDKAGFQPTLRTNDLNVRIPTRNTNYSTDSTITYYSHAIKDPNIPVSFPTTFVGSTVNPFSKNCVFSADIERDVNARRTDTHERPTPLPTLKEYKALTSLSDRLMKTAKRILTEQIGREPEPGASLRYILSVFHAAGPGPAFSPDDVQALFTEYFDNFTITLTDRTALLSAYDFYGEQKIVLSEFAMFLKRTPSPRRLELLDLFYGMLDPDGQGVLYCEHVRERIQSYYNQKRTYYAQLFIDYMFQVASQNGLALPELSRHQFLDYYVDVSSETTDDDAFEKFLQESWGFLNDQ